MAAWPPGEGLGGQRRQQQDLDPAGEQVVDVGRLLGGLALAVGDHHLVVGHEAGAVALHALGLVDAPDVAVVGL
jgi:hypothetical protein